MRSRVTIAFQAGLKVATPVQYKSIGVVPEMDGNLWKGISVEVNHEDNATPFEIVEKARTTARDVLSLVGVGRGLELPLSTTHIWPLPQSVPAKGIGMLEVKRDASIVRQLVAMPSEDLVTRLASCRSTTPSAVGSTQCSQGQLGCNISDWMGVQGT